MDLSLFDRSLYWDAVAEQPETNVKLCYLYVLWFINRWDSEMEVVCDNVDSEQIIIGDIEPSKAHIEI